MRRVQRAPAFTDPAVDAGQGWARDAGPLPSRGVLPCVSCRPHIHGQDQGGHLQLGPGHLESRAAPAPGLGGQRAEPGPPDGKPRRAPWRAEGVLARGATFPHPRGAPGGHLKSRVQLSYLGPGTLAAPRPWRGLPRSQCLLHVPSGVFLSPPPAAGNEMRLEEVGSVSLVPLADMLGSPQPGTTAGPLVSPLTGPLNTLLSCQGAMSQNRPLTSLLTSPVAMAPAGTLTSSLGLPSTSGALTGHLSSPVAMAPAGTLTSSLGLPLTGPLTGHLSSPLSQSSPLLAPITGPMTVPLSSPLLAPPAAPLAVPQNLLANPVGNLAMSESTKVRLAEPLHGYPSAPPPLAGTGPTADSKAPLSTEQPRPTQDPDTLGVMFVGVPLQTSTPISTVGAPSPTVAFSFGSADPGVQPSIQGPAVPAPVPISMNTPSATTVPSAASASAPQAAATNYTPPSTGVVQQTDSAPTQPSLPPHASSAPTSVTDARGPRAMEPTRKNVLELERKLAHRKTSKFPDAPREPKQLAWERLVGEIAFQLDRRILSSIFPERARLYGFTVSNIPEKIIQASLNPSDHKLDEELCQTLTQRYVSIMNRLQSLGYNGRVHPALTEQLVNAYGILRERPELAASEGGSYTVDFLQRVLVETVHPSMLTDALLLLSCLSQLAHDDGKPMFIW
ncbi:LOW QUALITY PROTEIN: speriolin [Choloepus didactylus]|nr:LOW QUALITY PROTEIN: speriolin [Choloepus didactylus]